MSQHDYDIANQTAPNFRSDLNDALGAIATNNSGATEPSVTYANQWWYDTSNDILKVRSEADDAWINVGYLDQSTNEFKPYVGGTQVDTQSTATWETGTSTTEGIVSPAKNKAAFNSFEQQLGVGQTWQNVSRSGGTTYQNTTGKPIQVSLNYKNAGNESFQVSTDGSNWITVASFDDDAENFTGVVPNQHFYRTTGGSFSWVELR